MDNIVAESNDQMINQLNFGLPETSQYITQRRFVNFFPSGSNTYSNVGGNNNIKFNISTDDNNYIDLSSIRLFATLENTSNTQGQNLRPLSGLHGFFQRYMLSVGGQQVQDIIEYNRHDKRILLLVDTPPFPGIPVSECRVYLLSILPHSLWSPASGPVLAVTSTVPGVPAVLGRKNTSKPLA